MKSKDPGPILRIYGLVGDGAHAAVARLVGYGGIEEAELDRVLVALAKGGKDLAYAGAMAELTERKDGIVTLNADSRRRCRVLLGPPPEDPYFAKWWELRGERPPASTWPPGDPRRDGSKAPRARAKAKPKAKAAGNAGEADMAVAAKAETETKRRKATKGGDDAVTGAGAVSGGKPDRPGARGRRRSGGAGGTRGG